VSVEFRCVLASAGSDSAAYVPELDALAGHGDARASGANGISLAGGGERTDAIERIAQPVLFYL
jgi:hypothetical protein